MDELLLAARLLLAAVFVVSGCAKLVDATGTQRTLVDFGVHPALAKPLGVALPLVECAIAVALLDMGSAPWASGAALALLFVFSGAIAVNLARGRAVECRCFGRLTAGPAGNGTLIRNAALAALAALVTWRGGGAHVSAAFAAVASPDGLAIGAVVLLSGVALAQAWFLVHVVRQHGRLLLRIEALERFTGGVSASARSVAPPAGLALGTPAPSPALQRLDGSAANLGALRSTRFPTLVFFSDPACRSCAALLSEVRRWQVEQADRMVVAVICAGSMQANRAHADAHGLTDVLVQREMEAAVAFKVTVTPSAVVIAADGRIASAVAEGPEAIRALVAMTVARPRSAQRADVRAAQQAAAPAD
jgi:hypothetical protein